MQNVTVGGMDPATELEEASTRRRDAATGRRRKWRKAGLAALLALAGTWFGPLHAAPPARTDRLLIKPKRNAAVRTTDVLGGGTVQRTFQTFGGLQVVRLPAGVSVDAAIRLLKANNQVEYAEPDYYVKLQGTEPNDFRYYTGELWGLHNTGYLGGTPGADIKAPEAWDIRTGAPNIIVALVDSGVRQTHEDLAPNLWRNPGEIPGNGIDDDGNGVIDDVHGFNAYLDNGEPEDDLGHGTHVAGTIGGVGNNSVGVVGVAWRVQLMPTKFTDPQGNGSISDAIACIDYARKHGAHVINASWGAPDLFNSTALRDAIAAARDAGIIFVTVAGNNQGDNDAVPYYPGAFDLDNIVVATATDRNDQLAFFANYGKDSVDLGAPGYNIFSTWFGSDTDYQYYNGGSMAVAHVSGAAALVRAQFPGENYRSVIKRILDGTDPLPTLQGKTATGGRLNLFKALGGAVPLPSVSIAATDAAAAEEATDGAVFTISRTGALTAALAVPYIIGGTARNGTDYALLTGVATIDAGATSTTVAVRPVDDAEVEGSETVSLTLVVSNAYSLGTAASAVASIADNDRAPLPAPQPPIVTIQATAAAGAEAGPANVVFTITRTGGTTEPLSVDFTLGGTAAAGSDFQAVASPVTIPAGAASVAVTLRPIDDPAVEGAETVTFTLRANAAYVLGTAVSASATIADNDTPPPARTVTVAALLPFTIELGIPEGQFLVTRTGSLTQPLAVRLAVRGTATNGTDYERIQDAVTIPAGKSSVRIPVAPLRDRKVEGTESVELEVVADAAYAVGTAKRATVQIFDDDLLWAFLAKIREN